MAVKDSQEGPRLVWRQKPEQQQWLEAREGAYLLRTNLTVNGAADLWKKYIQLTEVEAAFRTLKSGLAIRPLFHQLEKPASSSRPRKSLSRGKWDSTGGRRANQEQMP